MRNITMGKFLFHIGYHKTATSLLQKILFAGDAGYFVSEPAKRQRIIETFVSPPPLEGANVTELQDLLSSLQHYDDGLVRVFSHERLAGYPSSGGIDQEIVALRIKNHFPSARILMVIREQKDMILSMYYQYVFDGGSLKLKDYLSGVERILHRSPQFSFEYYDYIKAFQMYQRHFGAENVLCLPYEMLSTQPKLFLNAIFAFCDLGAPPACVVDKISSTRVNSRKSALELYMRRFANKLFRTQLSDYGLKTISNGQLTAGFKKFSPYFPVVTAIENRQDKKSRGLIKLATMNRYQRSNSELSRLIKVNLGDYGYET